MLELSSDETTSSTAATKTTTTTTFALPGATTAASLLANNRQQSRPIDISSSDTSTVTANNKNLQQPLDLTPQNQALNDHVAMLQQQHQQQNNNNNDDNGDGATSHLTTDLDNSSVGGLSPSTAFQQNSNAKNRRESKVLELTPMASPDQTYNNGDALLDLTPAASPLQHHDQQQHAKNKVEEQKDIIKRYGGSINPNDKLDLSSTTDDTASKVSGVTANSLATTSGTSASLALAPAVVVQAGARTNNQSNNNNNNQILELSPDASEQSQTSLSNSAAKVVVVPTTSSYTNNNNDNSTSPDAAAAHPQNQQLSATKDEDASSVMMEKESRLLNFNDDDDDDDDEQNSQSNVRSVSSSPQQTMNRPPSRATTEAMEQSNRPDLHPTMLAAGEPKNNTTINANNDNNNNDKNSSENQEEDPSIDDEEELDASFQVRKGDDETKKSVLKGDEAFDASFQIGKGKGTAKPQLADEAFDASFQIGKGKGTAKPQLADEAFDASFQIGKGNETAKPIADEVADFEELEDPVIENKTTPVISDTTKPAVAAVTGTLTSNNKEATNSSEDDSFSFEDAVDGDDDQKKEEQKQQQQQQQQQETSKLENDNGDDDEYELDTPKAQDVVIPQSQQTMKSPTEEETQQQEAAVPQECKNESATVDDDAGATTTATHKTAKTNDDRDGDDDDDESEVSELSESDLQTSSTTRTRQAQEQRLKDLEQRHKEEEERAAAEKAELERQRQELLHGQQKQQDDSSDALGSIETASQASKKSANNNNENKPRTYTAGLNANKRGPDSASVASSDIFMIADDIAISVDLQRYALYQISVSHIKKTHQRKMQRYQRALEGHLYSAVSSWNIRHKLSLFEKKTELFHQEQVLRRTPMKKLLLCEHSEVIERNSVFSSWLKDLYQLTKPFASIVTWMEKRSNERFKMWKAQEISRQQVLDYEERFRTAELDASVARFTEVEWPERVESSLLQTQHDAICMMGSRVLEDYLKEFNQLRISRIVDEEEVTRAKSVAIDEAQELKLLTREHLEKVKDVERDAYTRRMTQEIQDDEQDERENKIRKGHDHFFSQLHQQHVFFLDQIKIRERIEHSEEPHQYYVLQQKYRVLLEEAYQRSALMQNESCTNVERTERRQFEEEYLSKFLELQSLHQLRVEHEELFLLRISIPESRQRKELLKKLRQSIPMFRQWGSSVSFASTLSEYKKAIDADENLKRHAGGHNQFCELIVYESRRRNDERQYQLGDEKSSSKASADVKADDDNVNQINNSIDENINNTTRDDEKEQIDTSSLILVPRRPQSASAPYHQKNPRNNNNTNNNNSSSRSLLPSENQNASVRKVLQTVPKEFAESLLKSKYSSDLCLEKTACTATSDEKNNNINEGHQQFSPSRFSSTVKTQQEGKNQQQLLLPFRISSTRKRLELEMCSRSLYLHRSRAARHDFMETRNEIEKVAQIFATKNGISFNKVDDHHDQKQLMTANTRSSAPAPKSQSHPQQEVVDMSQINQQEIKAPPVKEQDQEEESFSGLDSLDVSDEGSVARKANEKTKDEHDPKLSVPSVIVENTAAATKVAAGDQNHHLAAASANLNSNKNKESSKSEEEAATFDFSDELSRSRNDNNNNKKSDNSATKAAVVPERTTAAPAGAKEEEEEVEDDLLADLDDEL